MSLLTLGLPGRFFSRGDARRGDVTKFQLGFRLLAMSGPISLAEEWVPLVLAGTLTRPSNGRSFRPP